MTDNKIKVFTDLITWQKGHQLVLAIYKQTETFPIKETYSLTDQMRRCAVSITSNIAEGFSRKSKKEKMQFYYMALGSTTELQNQLIIAKDLHYLKETSFQTVLGQIIEVHRLINSLIKASRDFA